MFRAVGWALLASAVAWWAMLALGVAGPDEGLYVSLLGQAWDGVVAVVWWFAGSVEYPQRAVLVAFAAVGFAFGARG